MEKEEDIISTILWPTPNAFLRFTLKEVFLRISVNSQKIPSTGVSF